MKNKRNGAAIALILFMLSCGIFTVQVNAFDLDPGPIDPPPPPPPPPPPANTGTIVITLNVPEFKAIGSQVSVSFNTLHKADKIYIYVDGVLKQTWTNTLSGSYTFIASSTITTQTVRVFAYNSLYEGVKTKQIRLQYPSPVDSDLQSWMSNSSDYARSFSPYDSLSRKVKVWEMACKVLEYGEVHYDIADAFSNPVSGTNALLHFAEDLLYPQYGGYISIYDCLTAYEMSVYFDGFDGASPDASDFIAPGRDLLNGDPNLGYYFGFDCSDYAAFISGIATVLNIPSRIVSLVDDDYSEPYRHLFAEVWTGEI
ncbi:MAG: hypothetical protein ACFFEV_07315, partial [Candidatus Thorarchaeota archaeon]